MESIFQEQLAGTVDSWTGMDGAQSEYWIAEDCESVSILLVVSMLSVIDLEGERVEDVGPCDLNQVDLRNRDDLVACDRNSVSCAVAVGG